MGVYIIPFPIYKKFHRKAIPRSKKRSFQHNFWFFGIIKHLQKRTFSLKKNAIGLILKITLTVGAAMLFEGMNSIVKNSADIVVISLTIVTRVIVFLYPAVSAWQNIYIVSGERFPPKAWMDRLNKFNENLNIKELTDEKSN